MLCVVLKRGEVMRQRGWGKGGAFTDEVKSSKQLLVCVYSSGHIKWLHPVHQQGAAASLADPMIEPHFYINFFMIYEYQNVYYTWSILSAFLFDVQAKPLES